jgi:hypothetical protein
MLLVRLLRQTVTPKLLVSKLSVLMGQTKCFYCNKCDHKTNKSRNK